MSVAISCEHKIDPIDDLPTAVGPANIITNFLSADFGLLSSLDDVNVEDIIIFDILSWLRFIDVVDELRIDLLIICRNREGIKNEQLVFTGKQSPVVKRNGNRLKISVVATSIQNEEKRVFYFWFVD